MRFPVSRTAVALVAAVLVFTSLGVRPASASGTPPVVQPRIIAANSNSPPCLALVCPLTVTLTYNTAVGVTPNAAAAFIVEDITNGQACTVVSVTMSPPPTPIVPPVPVHTLYLRANCVVNPGDVIVLVYRENPAGATSYVYNAHDPQVHALSPQAFAWFNGPFPTSSPSRQTAPGDRQTSRPDAFARR